MHGIAERKNCTEKTPSKGELESSKSNNKAFHRVFEKGHTFWSMLPS